MSAKVKKSEAQPVVRDKTIRIRGDLHRKLKLRAVDEGRELYELAEEWLEWAFMRDQAQKKRPT